MGSDWLSVSLSVEGAEAMAAVERVFERFGAKAVCLDEPGEDLLEPPPGAMPLAARMRMSALFPAGIDLASLARALAEGAPGAGPPAVEAVGEAWKAALLERPEPLCFGRLEIVPVEDAGAAPPAEGVARVLLAPGLGFGSGRHPSTALCLEALARHELEGLRVLDYGCGSGILAIAALRLGAARAVAVDHDPQALLATADNARRNRVRSRLAVLPPERLRSRAGFDLILANILAGPLIALAPRLSALLAPSGILILAGILAGQEEEVVRAYSPVLSLRARSEREGWVGLQFSAAPGR
jgi:ribosomal protein L11 methyltransferase